MRIDIESILDQRLSHHHPAPLVVGFSGGGDSLALLLSVKAWADRHGRGVLAVTVDHGLRAEGAEWALWCRDRARRLGVAHQTAVWQGAKPSTGRSAAARAARHRLLAEAARSAGAHVILLGHTADDVAEAAFMRDAGSTVPSPRIWSASPVWPEGRDRFLLRPLLGVRRAAIRKALVAAGETWIDDPGNADGASLRAEARLRLESGESASAAPIDNTPTRDTRRDMAGLVEGPAGDIAFPVETLAPGHLGAADFGAALLCAAGTERPARRASIDRLMNMASGGGPFVATLAGARVEGGEGMIHVMRDAGEIRRAASGRTAMREMGLPVGRAVVWDGRFELLAASPGARVGPLAGKAVRLARPLREAIRGLSPAARGVLPLVTHADETLELPTVSTSGRVEARSLALDRLRAARGMIATEAGALARL